MKPLYRALSALLLAPVWAPHALAGVTIGGTRVVYPSDQRDVSLSMVNDGKEARVIQAWVDTGDAGERPETTGAPFLVNPSIARVDPGKGQTLRIMFTGAGLAQDRESVFWLNVLEIPPKPKGGAAEAENFMQLAVRSRMKLFYRPAGLPGKVDDAVAQATWRLVKQGDAYAVECANDTPYTISMSDIRFNDSAQVASVSKGAMCPAKGSTIATVSGKPASDRKLVVTVINDFGGFNERTVDYVE